MDGGPGRVRRTAARVAALALALFWGWVFYGIQDVLSPYVNGDDFYFHYLTETGWGLFFLVLVSGPLVALAVRPGSAVPLTQVLACSVALVVAALLGTSPKHLLPALGLALTVALLAVLGGGRPGIPLGRPAPVSTLLAAVALLPAVPYAWHMARGTLLPEKTAGLDHYPVQAAFALAVVLTALLAAASASRHERIRWLPALTAGLSAAWMGVLSTHWPDHIASFGTTWGWAAVAWATALVLAVAVEGRRPDVA